MCEYLNILGEFANMLGDFIKDYGSFLFSLGTFLVAWRALKTWQKRIRFEYASKAYFLLTEYYNRILYYEPSQKNIKNVHFNELRRHTSAIKFIYPIAHKKIKILEGVANAFASQQNNLDDIKQKENKSEIASEVKKLDVKIERHRKKLIKLYEEIIFELKDDIEVMKKPLSLKNRIANYWKKIK